MTQIVSISYVLGSRRTLHDLATEGVDSQTLAALNRNGLREYRVSDVGARTMVRSAIQKLLESIQILPYEVGAVITCGSWGFDEIDVIELCNDLGLGSPTPIHVSGVQCDMVHLAVLVADSLIKQGTFKSVLLCTSDYTAPGTTRILSDTITVCSDGAAACLLSRRGLRDQSLATILFAKSIVDPQLLPAKRTDRSAVLRRQLKGIEELFRFASEYLGSLYGSRILLDPTNMNDSSATILASASRIKFDDVFKANVARLGHVMISDNLINLSDMMQSGIANSGDRIVMSALGPYSRGITILAID